MPTRFAAKLSASAVLMSNLDISVVAILGASSVCARTELAPVKDATKNISNAAEARATFQRGDRSSVLFRGDSEIDDSTNKSNCLRIIPFSFLLSVERGLR
jgi:hypothetical protein